MERRIRFLATALLGVIFVIAAYFTIALTPLAPSTFTPGKSSTIDPANYPAQSHNAYAGNITALSIYSIAQTKHWQGYYGNITGTIVLDDADGYTLYDWPNDEPKGEIYATVNSTTPDWASVICFNFTGGYGGLGTLSYWEAFYNMTYNDVDGLNETFNMTQHPVFDIGDVATISANTCPSTYMHVNDQFQTDKFSEVLLQDSQGILIFTSIIENDDTGNNTDVQGYRSTAGFTPDFQMIVAEDGTSRTGGVINTATTTYYFYLDIE